MKRIFLDMDGVLVDYYGGVLRATIGDTNPWPYKSTPGKWNFYEEHGVTTGQVAPLMDADFYSELKWLPDGREILELCEATVGPRNVFLLSSPWDTNGCFEGKMEWVRRNMKGYERRVLIGPCKEACAHPDACLIDDADKNCNAFAACEGKAILYPRPWNSKYLITDQTTGRPIDGGHLLNELRSWL